PSDRVQSGTFGAVLMRDAPLVARCVEAMRGAGVPVTVKCRIGVDDQDPETVLPDFIRHVREAGAARVTVHARKAWLQGLSPKENREVPPLDYPLVHAMQAEFPDLDLWINGGIATLGEARPHLDAGMDGVMIGRATYHRPFDILAGADAMQGGGAGPSREGAALAMIPHIRAHLAEGGRLHSVTRHMLGLFHGRPGARRWKRILSEGAGRPGADEGLLHEALAAVTAEAA
ncbi:MAG: tRNA dihydrouridine(20/20a) synthase DusA, partial [Hasllibacter sp.]